MRHTVPSACEGPGLGHRLFEDAAAGLRVDEQRYEAVGHIPALVEAAFDAGATLERLGLHGGSRGDGGAVLTGLVLAV